MGLSTGPCCLLSTEVILCISPGVRIYCPSWLFDNLQTSFLTTFQDAFSGSSDLEPGCWISTVLSRWEGCLSIWEKETPLPFQVSPCAGGTAPQPFNLLEATSGHMVKYTSFNLMTFKLANPWQLRYPSRKKSAVSQS